MTRQDAYNLYLWLENSYPRNYREADERRKATTIDNLAEVFRYNAFADVLAEYKRVYATQKNEPHPSEIRAAIKSETRKAVKAEDPLEVLKRHPKWDEMCRAYGERACRRAAKLCVETASIGELRFRLENDIPCTEKDYSAEVRAWKTAHGKS